MTQPNVEEDFKSMDNLDFTLSSRSIQPSSPTEESVIPFRYDYSTSESFYEIDVGDLSIPVYPDQDFRNLISEFQSMEQLAVPSPIMDELNALLTEGTEVLHSTESNDMAGPVQSTDEQLAMIKSGDPTTLPVIRPQHEKLPIKNLNDQSISLSDSVAVTVPTPNQLQLVHPLEDTYRARYKSDYFPQKGAVRRPRYVADNVGNHYVTLQLPAEYNRDLTNECIRISLITTSIDNRGHFYSPYKFQIDHNNVKIPDQNPMYLSVQQPCRGRDSSLKYHLVLIKSKLDQLNNAQPLKPFPDTIGSVQNIISEEKLSPKELINKYQLEKSHIAFTLCTKLPDGTYEVHPETTIISSIITELPPKQSGVSNAKPKTSTANTGKKISCPNCSHCFDLPDGEIVKKGEKRKLSSSTLQTSSKSTTNSRTIKKKMPV